jgi:hypothetical protein
MRTVKKLPVDQRLDLVGTTHGRLTVTKFGGRNHTDGLLWIVRCQCGCRNILIPANRLHLGVCGATGCKHQAERH